jgi:hypothetical protein
MDCTKYDLKVFDCELVNNICLSIAFKKNLIYNLPNIEDRIQNLFFNHQIRTNIKNAIIDTCLKVYNIRVDQVSINNIPNNITTNPQIQTGYFKTNDSYVFIQTSKPYFMIYKNYKPFKKPPPTCCD